MWGLCGEYFRGAIVLQKWQVITETESCVLYMHNIRQSTTAKCCVKGYTRTLDIIVEGAVLLPVLPEEAEGIMIPKVLKLDQCVLSIFVHHSLHELIYQIIVGLRAVSLLVQAHVQWILEESLVGHQKHAKDDKVFYFP